MGQGQTREMETFDYGLLAMLLIFSSKWIWKWLIVPVCHKPVTFTKYNCVFGNRPFQDKHKWRWRRKECHTHIYLKKTSSAHFAGACPISEHFAAVYMKSSDEQLYGRREHLATHFPFFSSKYQIALSNLVSNLVPEYVSWAVPRYIFFFKPNNLE